MALAIASQIPKISRDRLLLGVVIGSDNIKKVKISNAPFCSWCRGTGNGSPNQNARSNVMPAKVVKKLMEVSIREKPIIRISPRPAISKMYQIACPHCPGATQADEVNNNTATIPRLDGLKMCLLLYRIINLLLIATKQASIIHTQLLACSKIRMDNVEFKVLSKFLGKLK